MAITSLKVLKGNRIQVPLDKNLLKGIGFKIRVLKKHKYISLLSGEGCRILTLQEQKQGWTTLDKLFNIHSHVSMEKGAKHQQRLFRCMLGLED